MAKNPSKPLIKTTNLLEMEAAYFSETSLLIIPHVLTTRKTIIWTAFALSI